MKLVLTTLVVGFGSAVIPLINIEAYLAAVGAAIEHFGVAYVAAAAAAGQTAGKVALYHASGWVMRLPWVRKKMATTRWRHSHDLWAQRIHERPNRTALLLFASATIGFPPLYLMAVLAGQLRVRLWLFVSVCLVGRFLRFLVILGAADWVFDVV